MRDIGQRLKDARVATGLSLQDIADRTKIRRQYLEAIEEGQFEKIPGPVYVKGFIKQYAQAVGLNGNDLVEMYRHEIHEEPNDTVAKVATNSPDEPRRRMDRHRHKPSRFNPRKVTVALIVLLILGGIGYFAYFMISTLKNETIPQLREPDVIDQQNGGTPTDGSDTDEPGTDEPDFTGIDGTGTDGIDAGTTPDMTADPLATDPSGMGTDETDPAGQTFPDQVSAGQQGQTGTPVQPNDLTGQTTAPLPAGSEAGSGTTAPVNSGGADAQVGTEFQIVVTGKSWIKIDLDGKTVFTQTVTDQTLSFTGQKMAVRAGNAGAVRVMQNGVLSEPFGKPGAVVTREFGQ